jgi:hypothetical protein
MDDVVWGVGSILLGGVFVLRSSRYGWGAVRQAGAARAGRRAERRAALLARGLYLLLGVSLVAWGGWVLATHPTLS